MDERLNITDIDRVDQMDVSLSKAFASALSNELNEVGFVSGSKRCSEFALFMDLSRPQASRLLNGDSSLALRKLSRLRSLGVSLDRIFDTLSDVRPIIKTIYLNGEPISVCIKTDVCEKLCSAALIPHETGYDLIAVKAGAQLPKDAIPIREIKFDARDIIAIIEDDLDLLDTLNRSMSGAFLTTPFSSASVFLDKLSNQDAYKAILMDWRLPDLSGEELIARIRQKTNAPIYILTGDRSASKSIERALSYKNIYYAAKPMDVELLIKLMLNAIRSAESFR
jgi:CheY-like chemotaxis protein